MRNKSMPYLIVLLIILFLVSCSDETANKAPVLLDVVEDISIHQDSSHIVTLTQVRGYDEDGEEFSIILNEGENYTASGTVITPITGYIGDLHIPVQLYDGKAFSNMDTMIVSVVQKIKIQPLYTDGRWSYTDSMLLADSVYTTELFVNPVPVEIELDPFTTVTHYGLQWKDADDDVLWLVGNDSTGQYLYGLASPYDTVYNPQLQHMYPCTLNTSWEFTLYEYVVTDDFITEDTTVTYTCTDTAAYITVPAGTFKCYEYTYSYVQSNPAKASNTRRIAPLFSTHRNDVGIVTEKIYYSPGVGLIQNLKYNGIILEFKKVLSDYYVEESVE